jgi:hypothetical protein
LIVGKISKRIPDRIAVAPAENPVATAPGTVPGAVLQADVKTDLRTENCIHHLDLLPRSDFSEMLSGLFTDDRRPGKAIKSHHTARPEPAKV